MHHSTSYRRRPRGSVATLVALPGSALRAGVRVAAAGAGVALDTAIVGAATAAGVGAALLRAPVTAAAAPAPAAVVQLVADVAREAAGGRPARRCAANGARTWIEVRGLDGPDGEALGDRVLAAIRDTPGVATAELHRPWCRLVVSTDPAGPTAGTLRRVVEHAEAEGAATAPRGVPHELPGDDVLLVRRGVSAATAGTGLALTAAGRYLRLPRLHGGAAAPVLVSDYHPRIRALVESALGPGRADLLLAAGTSVLHTLTLSPASSAVEAATRTVLVGETLAMRRAWRDFEPDLAPHAATARCPRRPVRPTEPPAGPVERYTDRAGWAGLAGAAAAGLLTGRPTTAGSAALVAVPKATRTARESFAATLARGLAARGVLTLRPAVLRRLDRVDAIVVDPRALYTPGLAVTRLNGVPDRDRSVVWDRARTAVERGVLTPGWHPVSAVPDVPGHLPADARVLIGPVHDRYASAVLAAARRAGIVVVSVEDEGAGSLRNGFDRLEPLVESMDAALLGIVERLQRGGGTVVVLTAEAAQALALADVGIGVLRDGSRPPWPADLMVRDLTGAWRILHALPAARTASRRGVEIARDASALGALLMLPGVPGTGPESVTAGAAAGLWAGTSAARTALAAPLPPPRSAHDWHALSVAEVCALLPAPSPDELFLPAEDSGWRVRTRTRAVRVVRRVGTRPVGSAVDFTRAVRTELSDPLTPVLATGSAASAVLGSPLDAVLVGSVLLLNAAISAAQRLRAERLLKRLLAVQDPPARRVAGPRGGRRYVGVPAARLRPGHVVEVRPGEVVPADGRILHADGVEVDESALTGESLPVVKQSDSTPGAPLAERACMLYAGTTVLTGTAVTVVTAVGGATETRRATAMAPARVREVGLQARLSTLTRRALPVSLGGGVLVAALGLLRGTGVRAAVTSGVAVTVAAVPEGLTLVATLAQVASARRLTKRSTLVRAPRSIEALSRVDVVCFDKTGTLSENRLRVAAVEPAPGFTREDVLACAARTGIPANGGPPEHATDVAIVESAHAAAVADRAAERTAHLPFRSGRAYAAAIAGNRLAVKGAPEMMLGAYGDDHPDVRERVHALAADGLRVIAVGQRDLTDAETAGAADDPDTLAELSGNGLRHVGLIGLSDTPRADAAGLLPALLEQGVAVRLVTGDHPVTAVAIAGELGLPVTADQVLSGAEWDGLSHTERERAVEERLVFARMSPEHKVQIVQALEHTGHVCAMVGDGANDAAAIRAASVGIGVASRGSDPARGAADVVLLEGRVAGLLDALDEGRVLWQRVQAAVSVLLGGNAGEVAFALLGSLITGRSPLNARQLLLVNMLTDALPAAALAVSTPRTDGSGPAPRPDESVLLHAMAARGATTAAAATAAWAMARVTGSNPRASTVALVALVGAQLGQTLLESRSPLVVATVLGSLAAMAALISTPGVSGLLGCVPVGPVGWTQALGCAAAATVAAAVAPTAALRLPAIGEVVTSVLESRDAGGASGKTSAPTARLSPTSGLQ
ncbi:cation-translocating P-type ATPase [Rhodococcus aetherivorans]|uniref:cation-translocating P-type ATPase n=1 Tax=Rhodococcus aetherivorans TaxID=191292 RepID=UPI00294A1B8F|nr:cation-translocating P-type ATPase [Rhodococcus aetherivorans]MDV6296227.1 cation-translocating P-type ATPase [Rhodococcus aetherivorans]